jgi:hypothetical protein
MINQDQSHKGKKHCHTYLSRGVDCSWYADGGRNVLLAQKLTTPSSHGTGTAASVRKTTKYN